MISGKREERSGLTAGQAGGLTWKLWLAIAVYSEIDATRLKRIGSFRLRGREDLRNREAMAVGR